jgi:hypothetical protein
VFPAHLEAVRLVGHGYPLRRDGAGSDLAPRWVVDLDEDPGRRGRSAERFAAGVHTAGDLRAPEREVVGDLEGDRDELDAAHVGHDLGELGGPSAGVAAEDREQCLPLAFVGAFVDEDPDFGLTFTGPRVAGESAIERDDVEAGEFDITVPTFVDVPSHRAVAVAGRRRLGERTGARDAALADIEPLALGVPVRDIGHRAPRARKGRSSSSRR